MTLQDLFARLATGELTNLPMAKTGSLDPAAYGRLTNYANQGLLKLYTRFRLKENVVVLGLYDEITLYNLLPRFALSHVSTGPTDNEPIRYIWDLGREAFTDEVIKIIDIRDECGVELAMNDSEDLCSVFTPQAKQLQVPKPFLGKALSLHYQQRHAPLQGELSDVITLPDVLEEALTSFVAYKAFSHMNSDNSNQKAQEFMAFFESICSEMVDRDLVNSSISQSNSRFCRGGWI